MSAARSTRARSAPTLRALLCLVGALAASHADLAAAQARREPGNSRRRPTLDLAPQQLGPTLAESRATIALAAELELQANRLRLARSAAVGRQIVAIDAMIAMRELVLHWLDAAHADAAGSWEIAADALRLADALPTLDGAIRARLESDEPAAAARDDALLATFRNAVATRPTPPTPPTPPPAVQSGPTPPVASASATPADRSRAIRRLLHALEPSVGTAPTAGWPIAQADGSPAMPAPPAGARLLSEMVARLAPNEPLRSALSGLLAGEPAASGDDPTNDEPARRDVLHRAALESLLQLLQALADSTIVDRTQREAFETHVAEVATRLVDPVSHEVARLEALEAAESGVVVRLAEALRPDLGDGGRSLAALPLLLLRLDTQVAADATPPPRSAKRAIAATLEAVRDRSTLAVEVRGPELVETRRSLLLECRQTEKALLDSLAALAEAPSPAADPATSSLLRGHRELVDTLRRLGELPKLAESVAALGAAPAGAPPAERAKRALGLGAQLTKMVRWSADPNRRPDGARAMAQLDRQVALFATLPQEDRLRSGSLDPLLGAESSRAALAAIDTARAAWVDAWASGDGGSAAARRLLVLVRLMRCAEAIEALHDDPDRRPEQRSERAGADAAAISSRLTRWGGWNVPVEALSIAATEAIPALREAFETIAADGPSNERLRELELASSMPRLALRLRERLGTALDSIPRGVAGTLAPLAEPPWVDAWAIERVPSLAKVALLARAWLEASRADAAPRTDPQHEAEENAALLPGFDRDLVERTRGAADRTADTLLSEFGELRGPIPTLKGWDGSDAEAKE